MERREAVINLKKFVEMAERINALDDLEEDVFAEDDENFEECASLSLEF